ncbi:MAG: TIGR03087 family PEP-CTERM/XrtA system glycosyltransferase [Proteobacteria bacterium]|nr:TIGR03087 family PEP-CTERM/XrtA system glycosyltransferase [Pseudomonadota bacterium]
MSGAGPAVPGNEILFIAHRLPFPPDRGDKIRSHHLLKALAALAPVHVATFADDDADFAAEGDLAAMAASYCMVRRAKPLPLAGVEALARGLPVSVTAFHSAELAGYVERLARSGRIGTIVVFSGQMGHYVPKDWRGRLVIDFVDVDSAKFAAYAEAKGPVKGWIDAREARLLAAEEEALARRAHASLLVSEEEAALFRAQLSPVARATSLVRALPNGIASDHYDPALVAPEPAMAALAAPRLIFTGQMDYAPNIDACLRVATRILPAIRAVLPDASFHVVGRNPTDALMAHHGKDGVHVWGRVEDIRTWLKAATLALVPLEIARGIQNKVLEAMAMELPVVASPGAATGIAARAGEHLAVAESDAALAAEVVRLARDPAAARAMGVAARRFVVERQSWAGVLADLPAILAGRPAAPEHADAA